jgi:hypothetical protein
MEKLHFAVFGCWFWEKAKFFSPNPLGNQPINTTPHSQILIPNEVVQGEGK